MSKIAEYIATWKKRGYPKDIPDEVPEVLLQQGLAPSYKAIALTILRNDLQCTSLGFAPAKSEWYGILKRIEIDAREKI